MFSNIIANKGVEFFIFFFHIVRTVSVAGKYSIFNRSLKLRLASCGDVHARAPKGCSLNSSEQSL